MSYGFRLLLKWARWIHVYVTMFGLLIVLFFAVTGFMLNHPDWFGFDDKHETVREGTMPTGILAEPNKLAVVEHLRKHFGATGAMETFNFKEDDDNEPIDVRFKAPGSECEASINRKDGTTVVRHFSYGIFGLLTDLHRGEASGRHTGAVWSLIIDGVAIMLLVVSLTGLVLWTSLRSRGQHGLALMAFGVLICAVIYFLFVP